MLGRWRKSILKRWAALVWNHDFQVIERDGLLWLANRKNFVDRNYGIFGDFEGDQRAHFFQSDEEPFDALLDVGANFGLYSILGAAKGVARETHAFEPDPRNRAQMQANLLLNGLLDVVQVHPQAVSAEDGTVMLSLHPATSTGTSRIVPEAADGISVSTVALDGQFPWSGKKLAIKIDIEGHELEALKGMRRLLRENDCWLQIESFDHNRPAVHEEMHRLGYGLAYKIDNDLYYGRQEKLHPFFEPAL